MIISINVPDEIGQKAKAQAEREGRSVSNLFSRVMDQYLNSKNPKKENQ